MTFICVIEVDYSLFNIDKRMVIDPCEQYDRPIDVPYKKTKVRNLLISSCAVGRQSEHDFVLDYNYIV